MLMPIANWPCSSTVRPVELERATARRADRGDGSVTAFPLVETTDSDISAYIPTNLISITDGQIYLDTARFERDERPAVDIGRSVSRIGAVAQPQAMRSIASNLRILIARFEALEALARVGLDIDTATQSTLHRGRVMREILRQERFAPRGVAAQVITLTAVNEGWLDSLEPRQARPVVEALLARARAELPELIATLDAGALPADEWRASLAALVLRLPRPTTSSVP
jgi:F-type H+-transporting ATPase subunit alpha